MSGQKYGKSETYLRHNLKVVSRNSSLKRDTGSKTSSLQAGSLDPSVGRNTSLLDGTFTLQPDDDPATASSIHLHVGCGRLGLGLVIPALCADKQQTLFVLQSPSPAWDSLRDKKLYKVPFYVNNEEGDTFTVITSSYGLRVARKKFRANKGNKGGRYLVISNDKALIGGIVRSATSFSCSVGTKGLQSVVVNMLKAGGLLHKDNSSTKEQKRDELDPNMEKLPSLYACENDHAAVDALADVVKNAVTVFPVLVDRICTDRRITENGVYIDTEEYKGEMVVMVPEGDDEEDPDDEGFSCPETEAYIASSRGDLDKDYDSSGDDNDDVSNDSSPWAMADNAVMPGDSTVAQFLHRRKILGVNGLHTTLGFLTLVKEEPDRIGLPLGDHKLLTWDSATEKEQRVIWSMCVARIFILLQEFPMEVMHRALVETGDIEVEAFGEDEEMIDDEAIEAVLTALIEYNTTGLERTSTIDDTTGRVLGGGVVNRYNGRLKNVQKFVRKELNTIDETGELLLQLSDLTENQMRKGVAYLVREAERFTLEPLPAKPE
ncbi:hypothetical protein SARC_05880 [Sphaeroforma arctica JP610]|uniref:Mannitol dehydrogenase C-terminal domain-containing protein n=1 Tax=Sphaeroforma arctica JP610 TaxID=667725 RepID=A0A0L0FZ16_9EUKA|nr:hypothetical protein SARC_05880 [Sphaeroforma arctica JP610]KNC81816.1 hypothetical protein SARC_05880 [Sphaeroforma arctica JP610]|eukprot:XP_014155718.1 hypothetical protein SARC_05880 [Sphaeroforma arctica JP610]